MRVWLRRILLSSPSGGDVPRDGFQGCAEIAETHFPATANLTELHVVLLPTFDRQTYLRSHLNLLMALIDGIDAIARWSLLADLQKHYATNAFASHAVDETPWTNLESRGSRETLSMSATTG